MQGISFFDVDVDVDAAAAAAAAHIHFNCARAKQPRPFDVDILQSLLLVSVGGWAHTDTSTHTHASKTYILHELSILIIYAIDIAFHSLECHAMSVCRLHCNKHSLSLTYVVWSCHVHTHIDTYVKIAFSRIIEKDGGGQLSFVILLLVAA